MLRNKMLVVGLLLSGLPLWASAAEPEGKKDSKGTTHTLKREQRDRAASISFNTDLGLAFDSLETLGGRIDQARKNPDPVGLANAANELAIAEKVSGKKAKLTSAELWKEAIEVAEMRDNAAELKALGYMVSDETVGKKLAKQAVVAEKVASELKTTKPTESTKGIGGSLRVVNNTNEIVTVFVNGFRQGTLYPGQNGSSFIGLPFGTTVVEVQGNWGGYWRKNVAQVVNDDLFIVTP